LKEKHLKFIGNRKSKIQNFRQGFTLIEMLVVIFVLGVGLIGAMSFFSINLNNQFEAKNELIAANLAQEGADLVRNIRDYNQLKGLAWNNNLDTGTVCLFIDFNSLASHVCSNVGTGDVCIDANSRYYQCVNGTATAFKRNIAITDQSDGSKKVVCTVTWNDRTTTTADFLYNNSF
jgi:prepilin-type N-terminal cleavage/methylation domain-containing protein